MPRTRVVFQTTPVPVEPETEGLFAGCPRTRSMTYVRYFNLNTSKLWVLPPYDKITFYGEEYKICSMDLNGKSIGIILTEAEMAKFLVKAKAHGHRWKAKVENEVDGRKVVQDAAYRMSLN